MVSESNDETNFPHKLVLTNTQVSKIFKAFTNDSSANIKCLKTQISKMVQLGRFLSKLLEPLLKAGLPLIVIVLKPLAKSVFVPLGLRTTKSATDAAFQNTTFGSGTTSLIF